MEGNGRPREDPRRGPTRLSEAPEPTGSGGEDPSDVVPVRPWRDAFKRVRGPWRVSVVEGSMLPAIAPGDWLLIDPLVRRWPRRGSVVVFEEPDSAELSVKRVEAAPGDVIRFAGGLLRLRDDEAWLTSDADATVTSAAGFGPPRDSHHYGPVPLELLVGRVWFRYGPLRRIGPVPARR